MHYSYIQKTKSIRVPELFEPGVDLLSQRKPDFDLVNQSLTYNKLA